MGDVLFVCIHNAGRSQMARALFNRIAAVRDRIAERVERPIDSLAFRS